MTWDGLTPPYRTIVADPPWDYPEGWVTQSRTPGKWEGPNHRYALPYSSLSPSDIAALPVGELADRDCRLFLWATNRYIPDACGILSTWGFRYRQTLVWRKLDANLWGSVAPNSAEFLLVGTKGSPGTGDRMPAAVIDHAQAKQHSRKPVVFMDAIEAVSPGPYVELFARAPRLGWDHWGYGYELAAASPDKQRYREQP